MIGRSPGARGHACIGLSLVLLLALPGLALAQGAAAQAPPAPAAEYLIGVGDVIQISVWAHPELDRTVAVDPQGNILLPPVGDVKAAGFTTRQLADRVSDRLSTYLRQGAATVNVVVKEYVSQGIHVSGAVSHPGRYGEATPPLLFDIINMAGGALPNGDLSRVQIIRRGGVGPHLLTVDVAAAMRNGTESQLPALRPGDSIVIPTSISLVGGTGNGQGVGVLGEVGAPGLYPVGPDEDLWVALALAGGPRATGNLSTIRVLTTEESGPTVVTVNLQETLERGNKRPYMIKPGDIVFVDARGASTWGKVMQVLSTTRDVANLVAIVRVLQNNP